MSAPIAGSRHSSASDTKKARSPRASRRTGSDDKNVRLTMLKLARDRNVDNRGATASGVGSATRGDRRWRTVTDVLRKHFHKPDIQAVRAVFASIAAHYLPGVPVWAMLVAPPGSNKTSTLQPLEDLPGIYLIDKLTPNTFLSGQIPEGEVDRPPSLLHRIGESGILIFPDFSTVLAMKRDDRASVLADMRRIYDGQLRKEVGTSGEPLEWRGRLTLTVAATPDVDRHYAIFQTLGERFVMVRWHRSGGATGGEQAALVAMNQDVDLVRRELKEAVHALFADLPVDDVQIAQRFRKQIAAIAEFAVRARTHVARDSSFNKNLLYVPEAEAPTRLAQQLCQLARGSARLSRRTAVTNADLRLVRRVGCDCIPALRWQILKAAARGHRPPNNIPKSTLSYAREDLRLLELFDGAHNLSPLASGLLKRAGLGSPHVPLP